MTETQVDPRLPSAVYDLALRLGANMNAGTAKIRLTQTGQMKAKLSSQTWMPFTASQTIATRTCDFEWLAKFAPFGVISARDALHDGEGGLDVMALGVLPLARADHSPALIRGELMRYLAEIAWAPDAIFLNPDLRWRVDAPDKLMVSAGVGEAVSDVLLSLNSEGRIQSAFAADRPRSASPPTLPTPWRGHFSDYRWHQNRWLPFAGEVAWEIDGHDIVYWQGRLTHWEIMDATLS